MLSAGALWLLWLAYELGSSRGRSEAICEEQACWIVREPTSADALVPGDVLVRRVPNQPLRGRHASVAPTYAVLRRNVDVRQTHRVNNVDVVCRRAVEVGQLPRANNVPNPFPPRER